MQLAREYCYPASLITSAKFSSRDYAYLFVRTRFVCAVTAQVDAQGQGRCGVPDI